MGCVLEQPNQRLLHATATSSAAAEEAFNLGTTTHQPRKLAEERVYQVPLGPVVEPRSRFAVPGRIVYTKTWHGG